MKKLFLVFGLGCFFSVSAQQQELFDINKHLLKKNTNSSKPTPNEILSLPYQHFSKDVNPSIGSNTQAPFPFYKGHSEDILPFYNMPCVKPDMNFFKMMPNPGLLKFPNQPLSLNSLPGDIPNAAWPRKSIVRNK